MMSWSNLFKPIFVQGLGLFVAMLFVLALTCPPASAEQSEVPVQTVTYAMGGPDEQETRIIRSEESWNSLWQTLQRDPELNFDPTRQDAVAIFLGTRNTGGYSIKLLDTEQHGEDLTIHWREIKPAPGTPVTMALTSPVLVATFPKVPGQITLCQAPPSPPPALTRKKGGVWGRLPGVPISAARSSSP